jgi:NADPH-dependent 2,4-dienoyl-CoA reductase/sulfur reductase-like enzyme
VVGASLAGVRAGEALRREGFAGDLTIVGEEDLAPYDRPPLSKQVLMGTWPPEQARLKVEPAVEADLRLATRATGLDLGAREVVLHTGERLGFDGCVIATGAVPRELPGTRWMAGLFTLRTFEDSLAIRAAAEAATRVVVVGAGFIGSEVASACRSLGREVTVLEAMPVPLERAVGAEMGAVLGGLHAANGTDLRLGAAVASIEGTDRVEGVRLTDGTTIAAEAVVVGIGVRPATDWLEGSGLVVDNGVVCDEFCRAMGAMGPADGIVAAGDVARWFNPFFGEPMRVEHWTNAVEQADAAARTLLDGPTEPYAPVPYFWSDQYGQRIRFVGHASGGEAVEVVEGSVEAMKFVATYRREGRLVAALTVNLPSRVVPYRNLILEAA